MRLDKNDKKQLEKRLEDPNFEKLFTELVTLRVRKYPKLAVTAQPYLSAKQLKDGEPKYLLAVVRTREIPIELGQALAQELRKEAETLAIRLAAFFPVASRWKWIHIFELLGINGNAAIVEQRQHGGRKATGITDKTKEGYKALAEMYYKTNLSQDEFCREMGISRSKLSRAIKFVSKNRQ